jgi:hypothetical protein
MEQPQKRVLTQCYQTPKDQARSLLCSLRIPLRSNTSTPLPYFLFFLLACWMVFFAQVLKRVYMFYIIDLFTHDL